MCHINVSILTVVVYVANVITFDNASLLKIHYSQTAMLSDSALRCDSNFHTYLLRQFVVKIHMHYVHNNTKNVDSSNYATIVSNVDISGIYVW